MHRRLTAPATRAGGRATGISWGSSSLAAGRTAPGGATREGRLQNRNETRPIEGGDGATLRSVGRGMKRLTRAEQGQTWSMKCLHETRVGRLAESRLEQKEDYGRDASEEAGGGKEPPSVTQDLHRKSARSLLAMARELQSVGLLAPVKAGARVLASGPPDSVTLARS